MKLTLLVWVDILGTASFVLWFATWPRVRIIWGVSVRKEKGRGGKKRGEGSRVEWGQVMKSRHLKIFNLLDDSSIQSSGKFPPWSVVFKSQHPSESFEELVRMQHAAGFLSWTLILNSGLGRAAAPAFQSSPLGTPLFLWTTFWEPLGRTNFNSGYTWKSSGLWWKSWLSPPT